MRRITTLSATLVLLAGCGTEGTLTDNPDTLAGSPDSEQPRDPDAELPPRPEVTLPCPIGHAEDEAGACIPVGIQGCADIFINPMTGLCEPGPEDCPPGHIPVFGEGCQSVNISGCVGSFIDPETGLCDPKPEDCPPGHMPVFDEGCVRVGVIDCHPDFIDPVTGHCAVDSSLCGDHQIPVPTQGCVSLDPPEGCGEGPFGNISPMSGDVFIDPSANASGANGSQGAPYPTLSQALSAVNSGGRLVLASGTYPEMLPINASISVIGRCSSMVTLTGAPGDTSSFSALVNVTGPHQVSLKGLTLSPQTMGVRVAAGGQVTLEHVLIDAAYHKGIELMDASSELSLFRTLVRDTEGEPWGFSGYGLEVVFGAQVSAEESAFIGNMSAGVQINAAGSSGTFRDVAILETLPEGDGYLGNGAAVLFGGAIELSDSVLRQNHSAGLSVLGDGASPTRAEATRVYIGETKYASFSYGQASGIESANGASLTLSESVVAGNQGGGLMMSGSTVTGDALLIAQNALDIYGTNGSGIWAFGGSTLTLTRSALVDNHSAGLALIETGTHGELSDVFIARTKSSGDGFDGTGIYTGQGASINLERVAIADCRTAGMVLGQANLPMTLTEFLVMRTSRSDSDEGGVGLYVAEGAEVTLTSAALIKNYSAGLFITNPGSAVTGEMLLISETSANDKGENGMGIGLMDGASLNASKLAILESNQAGILAFGNGTSLSLDRALIARSRPAPIIIPGNAPGGVGLNIGIGPVATVTQSAFVDLIEAGVSVVAGELNLSQSVISEVKAGEDERFGDGVLANEGSVATLSMVASVRNARAGFLVNGSAGLLSQSLARDNTLGLVTQGAHPTEPLSIGDDNIILGNTQELMSDQALAVPNLSMETPSMPLPTP